MAATHRARPAAPSRFEDGSHPPLTTVIWATGFSLDHSWIDAPIFDAAAR